MSSYKKRKYYEIKREKRLDEKNKRERMEKVDSVLEENDALKEKLRILEEENQLLKEKVSFLEIENEKLKKDLFIERSQEYKEKRNQEIMWFGIS